MTPEAFIDGVEVPVEGERSILDAARASGAAIPTLCHDPRLDPAGSCRLCLVKVEGRRLPLAACAQRLEAGMRVTTSDAELRSLRRTILRLLLSENPSGDCVKCRELGPCELHRLAEEYDVASAALAGATSGARHQDANPFILRDYAKCIYCYRCTRVCAEVEQAHAIVPAGRGFATRIATPFDGGLLDSPCTFCGQCIQTCPTGALADRKMLGRARAAEVAEVGSICPFCGTGCGITLRVAGGQVIGATPDWSSAPSQGSLCVKGQFGLDFIHRRDRLTIPLIRRGGALQPASWEEAYGLIARQFTAIKAESGPEAFAFWSSARGTSEANYLMQKLARAVIGTNNIDNCART